MHKRKGVLANSPALVSLKLCIFFRLFPPFFVLLYPFSAFFTFSALFILFIFFSAFLTLPCLLLSFYILLYLLFILFYPFSTVCCLISLFTISQSFISYSFILIRPFPYLSLCVPFYLSLVSLLLFLFMCSLCSDLIF